MSRGRETALTIAILVLLQTTSLCQPSAAYAVALPNGKRNEKKGMKLTKRENASLNSETCSSVNESACKQRMLCQRFRSQEMPPRKVGGNQTRRCKIGLQRGSIPWCRRAMQMQDGRERERGAVWRGRTRAQGTRYVGERGRERCCWPRLKGES